MGFQGLAAGVAHMHEQGIVDQDLHAGNVLYSADGQTLVKADLGRTACIQVDGRPNKLKRWM